ncbi:hypothetical protein Vadar_023073 [Vaccinium darrowii]|uniref:Uncharacterized protein n=1 Tax=Vaccinium darrowii TaxID=229202 RepID=A0ACB7XBP5_9ERIC|nr:hypothetical protein Vadar_023073 [Vaccinium darrowii]
MALNHFQGSIPSELGRLLNLKLFQIGGNNLSGEVPPSIYNISSLLYLDVGDNQFYGSIPQDIGFTLPNLLGLYVGVNQFTGHLPVSISNASGLQEISFPVNNFAGTMLTTLGSLKDLVRLTVSVNQLETDEAEGLKFLTSLTNCSKLQVLDIGTNRFKGELPASIANFSTALQQFLAGANQISGSIPEGITNLIGLTRLAISRNSITGEIPDERRDLKEALRSSCQQMSSLDRRERAGDYDNHRHPPSTANPSPSVPPTSVDQHNRRIPPLPTPAFLGRRIPRSVADGFAELGTLFNQTVLLVVL